MCDCTNIGLTVVATRAALWFHIHTLLQSVCGTHNAFWCVWNHVMKHCARFRGFLCPIWDIGCLAGVRRPTSLGQMNHYRNSLCNYLEMYSYGRFHTVPTPRPSQCAVGEISTWQWYLGGPYHSFMFTYCSMVYVDLTPPPLCVHWRYEQLCTVWWPSVPCTMRYGLAGGGEEAYILPEHKPMEAILN